MPSGARTVLQAKMAKSLPTALTCDWMWAILGRVGFGASPATEGLTAEGIHQQHPSSQSNGSFFRGIWARWYDVSHSYSLRSWDFMSMQWEVTEGGERSEWHHSTHDQYDCYVENGLVGKLGSRETSQKASCPGKRWWRLGREMEMERCEEIRDIWKKERKALVRACMSEEGKYQECLSGAWFLRGLGTITVALELGVLPRGHLARDWYKHCPAGRRWSVVMMC